MPKLCDFCKQIIPSISVDKLKRNAHFFCSVACKNHFRWGSARSVPVRCAQCGEPAGSKAPSRLKDRPLSFCSRACYGRWRTANLSGDKSPEWKGGYREKYGKALESKRWRRIARFARARDGYKCTQCGKPQDPKGRALDVHHIDRRKGDAMENLLTVCRLCHKRLHQRGVTRLVPQVPRVESPS